MRGQYEVTQSDRVEFWTAMRSMCSLKEEWIELSNTHLNLSNCEDLLSELGYEAISHDTNGWDMDFWWKFECEGLPDITVSGCGYTAGLDIRFTDIDRDVPIDTDKVIERINKVWGEFFLISNKE